ncbi:MAG: D-glycero-D-manno-heptose 7-phosphate kinase [Thaumarchaeota archaeon]|nr:MAG: D-glycero-D-manno-heptose 7-phosphate kinase [Nitrososphaerota archaeon]
MLLGIAPLRISFGGGGTDLEEYHNIHEGFTISATINKFTYVFVRIRNDSKIQSFSPDFATHLPPKVIDKITPSQGHEIVLTCLKEMKFNKGADTFFFSDVSLGSGLGASSSLTTNFVKVILELQNKKWTKSKIAMKAYSIGHDVLKWGIGKQDEFASAYGGINLYKFTKDKVNVTPVSLKKSTLKELQNNSLLFHMGSRGHSSKVLKRQVTNIEKSSKKTLEALYNTKKIAVQINDALKQNDLTAFVELINQGWKEKKKHASGVTNKRIDEICKIAFNHGAEALKVTGAGGGGHLYMYAKPSKHKKIEQALKKIDVKNIPFEFIDKGAKVNHIENL